MAKHGLLPLRPAKDRPAAKLTRWSTVLALVVFVATGPAVASDFLHPAFPWETPSHTCLQCHDGAQASALHSTHPVGVDYLAAQAKSGGKLRPPPLLPPEVHLVEGRVECTSCHDVSTEGALRLNLQMDRSRLCFGCHAL